MIYEALTRGNPDGTISGGHVIEWIADGTAADGSPRYRTGNPRPVTANDLTALMGEQNAALIAQVMALTAERDEKAAALTAMTAERDALQAQVAAAQAVPGQSFLARDLVALLTPDDYARIAQAVAADPTTGLLWAGMLAQGDTPISVTSERFLAGWAKLKEALGDTRAAEIAAALQIPQ